jgi:ligand-binding SRPBCC domain-containing protein
MVVQEYIKNKSPAQTPVVLAEVRMAQFETVQSFPKSVGEVFEFISQPAHLIQVSPPELHMRVVEGPVRVQLGSRIVIQGRRWGIPQRMVSEITAYEPNVMFADTQREGPFKRWVHSHHFEAVPGGTRVTDRVDYEPPGGLLGLVMTARMIEHELRWVFDYRRQELAKLLGKM